MTLATAVLLYECGQRNYEDVTVDKQAEDCPIIAYEVFLVVQRMDQPVHPVLDEGLRRGFRAFGLVWAVAFVAILGQDIALQTGKIICLLMT